MAIRRHEPIPEEQMAVISPHDTICQELRDIFWATKNPLIKLKTRVATSMAKSMTKKLGQYKHGWERGFWDINKKYFNIVGGEGKQFLVRNKEFKEIPITRLNNFEPIARKHSKPIDVLLLAKDDWANTGYRFWRCLMALGLNAVMFKGNKHPFNYPNQAPLHPSLMNESISCSPNTVFAPGLESLLRSAHVVHLISSTYPICNFSLDAWQRTNVVVQHGGTTYRQFPKECNDIFNQFANASIIQCPDLLSLGAKNEHLIYYPVDTEMIRPDLPKPAKRPIVIGHFPSNPEVKGTATVLSVIEKLTGDSKVNDKFLYVGVRAVSTAHIKSWEYNLSRMAMCDVIIESCAPVQNGKKYGEWGNAALEAAASGCVVVTNSLSTDIYKREYGNSELVIANNPEEMEKVLREIIVMAGDGEALINKKRQTRMWVEEKHSIEATAKRLWDKIYRCFF